MTSTPLNAHRRDGLKTILGLALLLTGQAVRAQAADPVQPTLTALISEFGKLRALAYNEVRDLKVMHAKRPSKLVKSELLYSKAKFSADAWIDNVRVGLAMGGKLDATALDSCAKTLQANTNALIDFGQASRTASSPNEKPKGMVLITAIAALIVSVGGFAIKIFETWSSVEEKKRNEIRAELELMRWGNFQQI